MSTHLYPLASPAQIEKTPSAKDGISREVEEELRAFGCNIIQQAGILLKQNQVAMSTAQILFQRFWYVSSMKDFGIGDVGMGALYLASKLEECPVRMRDLINVYHLLLSRATHAISSSSQNSFRYTPMAYFSAPFYELKDALVIAEMQILKRLGFNVNVVLPYGTLVNYLRVLNMTNRPDVCRRAWGYLNDALQTPVYVLYPVPSIVCAAIFLTARHLAVPLPSEPPHCWWTLFDAEWDDVWNISGYIMRLYRQRSPDEKLAVMRLVNKREVRKWIEAHAITSVTSS